MPLMQLTDQVKFPNFARQAYRGTEVDFADALIVHKALKTASKGNGLDAIYTFDSVASQLPRMADPG